MNYSRRIILLKKKHKKKALAIYKLTTVQELGCSSSLANQLPFKTKDKPVTTASSALRLLTAPSKASFLAIIATEMLSSLSG